MKQIFLHLESAKLSSQSINELRKAGYIPIKVKTFADTKIIDGSDIAAGDVSKAAIAFSGTPAGHNEGSRTLLGRYLAEQCSK